MEQELCCEGYQFEVGQVATTMISDSSDRPRERTGDQRSLRRLAQNREAARKSRLRKKNYAAKDIRFGVEARALMLRGIEELADAVKVTMGLKFEVGKVATAMVSDSSDRSRERTWDQRSLRRLAQNREAARKSRLRKKMARSCSSSAIRADIDNSGTIDYGEFIAATLHLNKVEREDNLFAAFSYFDKDGSSYITHDELQKACEEFGIEEARLGEMIQEIDLDNDGRIDYNEFVAMMHKGNTGLGKKGQHGSLSFGLREALKLGQK